MGWFGKKDPIARLRKEYEAKAKEALDKQRAGDVLGAALLTAEAEELLKRIEELETKPAE